MAHFAELDDNNIVLRVIVIGDEVLDPDNTGTEDESLGIAFCQKLYGDDTNWKQTSYNSNIRKQFAGIDYWYDETNDIFVMPKPHESWTLADDYVTAEYHTEYEPPVAHPNPETYDQYWWHEPSQSWVNKDDPE
jgi:hypothetical protein